MFRAGRSISVVFQYFSYNLTYWTMNMESINLDKEEILNYCDKLNPAAGSSVH